MEIHKAEVSGIPVVSLHGRLDAPAAPEAEDAFSEILRKRSDKLLIDLDGVEYISSGGLRVMIMLMRAMAKTGGDLKLCGLNPFVREVFEITHLSDRFSIYVDRAAALKAFSGD